MTFDTLTRLTAVHSFLVKVFQELNAADIVVNPQGKLLCIYALVRNTKPNYRIDTVVSIDRIEEYAKNDDVQGFINRCL